MAFDPEQFEHLLTRRKAEKLKDNRTNLSAIQQAAIKADLMTGDPNWDIFLTYLQENSNKNQSSRDALLSELSNPSLVNPDQVAAKRIALIQCNERIRVLEHVIALPTLIKKLGEAASSQLKELDTLEVA